jgi:hypothetical protein
MNNILWLDAIGWAGAAALLLAYAMVSLNKVAGDSPVYQLLNIAGSVLLAVNTIAYRAYPSTFVNMIWIGIAGFTLATRKRRRSD